MAVDAVGVGVEVAGRVTTAEKDRSRCLWIDYLVPFVPVDDVTLRDCDRDRCPTMAMMTQYSGPNTIPVPGCQSVINIANRTNKQRLKKRPGSIDSLPAGRTR